MTADGGERHCDDEKNNIPSHKTSLPASTISIRRTVERADELFESDFAEGIVDVSKMELE